jgi:hypothetical protein
MHNFAQEAKDVSSLLPNQIKANCSAIATHGVFAEGV